MLRFSLSLALAIVMMVLMERLVKPQAVQRRLLHRLSLLSVMPAVVLFMTIFMASYRPILALGVVLITFSTIIVFNNAKYAALQEPLVFSDFALLRQMVQHPALYLKHIGILKLLGLAVAATAGVTVDLLFEKPEIARRTVNDFFPLALYLFVVLGMIYSITRGPLRGAFLQLLRRFGTETDVRRDIDKLSLVVCLIFYFLLANEKSAPAGAKPSVAPTPPSWPERSAPLPPVIVVQSESFFDARRLHPSIPQEVLARWDALGAEAAYRGHLRVPAWGANTMRTEFAFLSGLPSEALGVHRFNPYLNLCKAPVWTLARQLRSMGYRTVCVHPYASSFFDRDKVFPNLGFDRFLDIESFNGAAKFGPYISDLAVADKIIEVLQGGPAPHFVFAITMENHGKWERGRLDGKAAAPDLPEAPLGSSELGLYLQHLANADAMAGRLTDYLRRRPGDGVFCMFGDHVPSLPAAFGRADYADASTDYLIWKKSGRQPRVLDVAVDVLGRLVLDAVLNEANHAAIRAQPSAV